MSSPTRLAVIGLGRMGSTIDEEGHGKVPYSVAASGAATASEPAAAAPTRPLHGEVF